MLLLAVLLAGNSAAQTPTGREVPALAAASVVGRWPAEEAKQGAVADEHFFYAISNDRLGKYEKTSGRRVAQWQGDPVLYPHMNACSLDGAQLVCAASNFPTLPMASAVEFFDRATLRHLRSVPLPPLPGSLTWIERRGPDWYAGLANYDEGHHGEPGRDHRSTLLVRLDEKFRPTASWHFPEAVLARFAPMSNSGGSWGKDGLLYVTGHDRAEMYALRLPEAGTVLELVAILPIPTNGQAIAWDPSEERRLWSIDRKGRTVVVSQIPPVPR
jgi:hypothetical protein